MGFFSNLFKRKSPEDAFAAIVMDRIRRSGEARPFVYDATQFRITQPDDRVFYLNNLYQEYLRAPKSEHERLFNNFLSTWHTSGVEAPDAFDDAKHDLMPSLRARALLEITLHRLADTKQAKTDLPHQVIGEHLVATLVYDLPHSTKSVNDELLEKWGVTYYEAMEVALQNLRERTTEYAQLGGVYAFGCADAYDATRLLLTDLVRSLEVDGDTIAMVPNRDRLYVCGSNDDQGLEAMITMAAADVQQERDICGIPLRLVGDDWELWRPPADHALRSQFDLVRAQWLSGVYQEQVELLNARHERDGIDVFVASYTAFQNEKSGRVQSLCVWTNTVDSLLPETDEIAFVDPSRPKGQEVVAQVPWEVVRKHCGDVMQPQGMYPERWRVREFPSEAQLTAIKAKTASSL